MNYTDKIESLIAKRDALIKEANFITRQIEDEISEIYKMQGRGGALIQRYQKKGDTLVVSFGRHWWVSADGDLLERAEEWEVDAAKEMCKNGIFEKTGFLKK